jgi:hypothetical protein
MFADADAATSPKPSKPSTTQPSTTQASTQPLQALTYSDGSASLADAEPRTLEVGGESVALTEMGPIVINTDGSLARISNWAEMSDREREVTKKRITKRNAERLAVLRSEQQQPPPQEGTSSKELNALPAASDD